MPILALDTASEACSVAIHLDNGEVIGRYEYAPRLQTQLLLPMVDELLAQCQLSPQALTAIAYSRGPGSFTGVRISAAAAQGLAFGWDLPVLAISSLQTLAQGAYRVLQQEQVISVFDARMSEIYLGAYQLDGQLMQPVIEEVVCPPASIPKMPAQDWALVGSGTIYADEIKQQASIQQVFLDIHPQAYDVAVLAQQAWQQGLAQAPELALPVYLRDSVWQKLPNKS